MCFKPVAKDNYSFRRRRRKDQTTEQVVTCFAVEEKEGVVLPAPTLPTVVEVADDGGGSRRRENGRDTWQALRAVLNETPLVSFPFSLFFSIKIRFICSLILYMP